MIAIATTEADRARGATLVQTFELPWPPTINTYWRHTPVRWSSKTATLVSEKGRAYLKEALLSLKIQRVRAYERDERVCVRILAYPPDNRVRDLDNLLKAPLDALQEGGVLFNDSQIDDLRIVRKNVDGPGRLEVHIALLEDAIDRALEDDGDSDV